MFDIDPSKIEGAEEYHEICSAVGHFFLLWAKMENFLSSILKMHFVENLLPGKASENLKLANALFGSMRFKTCSEHIKRIMIAENLEESKARFIKIILDHIGDVETFRNDFAHKMIMTPSKFGDKWSYTNVATINNSEKLEVTFFDTSTIHKCCSDLQYTMDVLNRSSLSGRLFSDVSDQTLPWQYKSSELKRLGRRSPNNRPKRTHPPKSSQG